jgi:murein DD-endopeptidase MepM/ murein hydrolase activator NlpD
MGQGKHPLITKNIRYYSQFKNRPPARRKNGLNRRAAHFGVAVLLGLIHALGAISAGLGAFLMVVVYRPLYAITRFFFYKVVVKAYGAYLSILNKLGWSRASGSLVGIIFHQKLVHVIVVLLTVLISFVNMTERTKADEIVTQPGQTILADLIRNELGDSPEEEQLIVETFDREQTITPLQQNYFDGLGAMRPQLGLDPSGVGDEESLATADGGATLVKPGLATTKITKRLRPGIIDYAVQPGDTVSTIAAAHDITVSTILWENNLSAYSIIRPGDTLRILPVSGLSYKIKNGDNLTSLAKRYSVEEQAIIDANKLGADGKLAIGRILVLPGAKRETYAAPAPKTYSGIAAIKTLVAAPSAKPVSGNLMNWPTAGNRITQYFSWRHTAVDIANKIGTPIYAADAGTVEYAGWGKGYGNQIVIDHGGGKKTRYAHLSKFSIEKGESVSKGQAIGEMGSTGWSTGSHLHFEIIIGGKKLNPLNHIR